MINFEKGFYYTITGGDVYGWKVSIMGRRLSFKFPTYEEAKARVSMAYLVYLRELKSI